MDPIEPQLVWLCAFLLCYTSSIDDVNSASEETIWFASPSRKTVAGLLAYAAPHLIGFFAALCCAISTQVGRTAQIFGLRHCGSTLCPLSPGHAPLLFSFSCPRSPTHSAYLSSPFGRLLKRSSSFLLGENERRIRVTFVSYEFFLPSFIVSSCVIRPAIDAGDASALFGSFFAVLIIGSLARMVADAVVAVIWQVKWRTATSPNHLQHPAPSPRPVARYCSVDSSQAMATYLDSSGMGRCPAPRRFYLGDNDAQGDAPGEPAD